MSGKLNKNSSFEELIRNKLEDYETPVDSNNWDAIEKSLTRSRRIKYIYTVVGVTVAAAAVMLIVTLNLPKNGDIQGNKAAQTEIDQPSDGQNPQNQQNTQSDEQNVQDKPQQNNQKQNAEKKDRKNPENQAKQQQNQLAANPVSKYNVETNTIITQAAGTEIIPEDPPLRSKLKVVPQTSPGISINISPSRKLQLPVDNMPVSKTLANKTTEKVENNRKSGNENIIAEIDREIKKTKNWSVSMSLEAGNYQEVSSRNSDLLVAAPILTSYNSSDYIKNRYKDEIMVPDNSTPQHGIPLSAKLIARKNLNSAWAVESGMSYTYLSTKYKWGKNVANQQLHYLGIPVNVVYYAVSKPKWNLYASAGGMLEKGVYASMNRTDNIDSKINMRGVQLSVNGAIGVTYKLYQSLGLFFEPQVGYFFDNEQPESIRTEWPVSVGLGAGLRFNF